MATHGKTYGSIGEEEFRYSVFKDQLRFVDKHNAAADAGVYSYHVCLYHFSDLTDEEFRAGTTGYLPHPRQGDNYDHPDSMAGGIRGWWPRTPSVLTKLDAHVRCHRSKNKVWRFHHSWRDEAQVDRVV
ncbi:hypothetical protein EJB05_43637, partial [Eragrostis curvula]